jgi:hypothetical protein
MRNDVAHRSQQELGIAHILVIDVSYRDTYDLGTEPLDGAPDGGFRVPFEHQVD